MRPRIYLIGFGLVSCSVLVRLTLTLLSLLTVHPRLGTWFMFPEMFGHPVPQLIQPFLPSVVRLVLFWLLAFLVVRRMWLFFREKSFDPPQSFRGVVATVVAIAVGSVALFAVTLVLSLLLHAGSGVPAGMLLLLAAFLLPAGVFWVELLSFAAAFRGKVRSETFGGSALPQGSGRPNSRSHLV